MLNILSIKKEYILITSTLLLLILCYLFAFKKTIDAWQSHNDLTEKVAAANDLGFQPSYTERKNNNLNQIINLYKADTASFRNNIISIISAIAEKQNVRLTGVPVQDSSNNNNNFILEKLVFEGDYFSLAKAINQLQRTNGIGKIRAENWKLTELNSSNDGSKKLFIEIYFEIVKN